MKKLFEAANRYVESSDWKTISVLKVCLISLGMMVGMLIRPKHKKPVFAGALGAFLLTDVPLTLKFYRIFTEKK